jgi:hypothetical protein
VNTIINIFSLPPPDYQKHKQIGKHIDYTFIARNSCHNVGGNRTLFWINIHIFINEFKRKRPWNGRYFVREIFPARLCCGLSVVSDERKQFMGYVKLHAAQPSSVPRTRIMHIDSKLYFIINYLRLRCTWYRPSHLPCTARVCNAVCDRLFRSARSAGPGAL